MNHTYKHIADEICPLLWTQEQKGLRLDNMNQKKLTRMVYNASAKREICNELAVISCYLKEKNPISCQNKASVVKIVEEAGILKENVFLLLKSGDTKLSSRVLALCICVWIKHKDKGRKYAFLELAN